MLVQTFFRPEKTSTAGAEIEWKQDPLVQVPRPVHHKELFLQAFWAGFSDQETVQKKLVIKTENDGVTPYVTPSPKKIIKIQSNKKIEKNQTQKKRYRGKGQKYARDSTFTIMLSNLRGFKGKKKSLEKILETDRPSILLLNETQMVGRTYENVTKKLYKLGPKQIRQVWWGNSHSSPTKLPRLGPRGLWGRRRRRILGDQNRCLLPGLVRPQ